MIEVQYAEKKIEVSKGTKVSEILKSEIEKLGALGVLYNNKVQPLDFVIENEGKLELITFENSEGKRIYNRAVIYILTKAINEIYPNTFLTVNYQITGSMFCNLDNMEVTDEFIENTNKKMREITNKNLPIRRIIMTKDEAIKFYEKEKTLRGIKQIDIKENKSVYLYYCEDYYDYLYGVLPTNTGMIKTYSLEKYKDGFLVNFPDRDDINKLIVHKESEKLFETLDEYDDLYKALKINTVYRLNQKILTGEIKEHILLAEALHNKKIANIATKISQKKGVKVILIAGPSSSGKTTFAAKLGSYLITKGLKPVTISVDNYFVERKDTPKDENGVYDFECLEAIDLELFNDHLTKLLNFEEVEVPEFDFKIGHKNYNGNKLKLTKDEVLIIEGIHCLNDVLTSSISRDKKYKIYISALTVLNVDYHNRISTTDTRLIRRIVRDNQYRGYSALHTLKIWYSVNRGENKNIFPYQESVDSMFNSSLIYELGVLRDKAIPLLKEITSENEEYVEAQRLIDLLNTFEPISDELIPDTSLIREFIGGSIFAEK